MILNFMKKILPRSFKDFFKLVLNYFNDFMLYKKYSTIFSVDCFKNKEATLILNYHSIEKGLLHKNIKPMFAKHRIIMMHKLLCDEEIINNVHMSQVYIGYKLAIEYYDLHSAMNIDISEYFTYKKYLFYKGVLKNVHRHQFSSGKIDVKFDQFYSNRDNFLDFSHSRKSIRNFTGEIIDINIIRNVIKLSNNAPSVCNRQSAKVYLIENKEKIDKCLKIQDGLEGYTENVNQLFILTVDRRYFYTIGERYQFYIDGGIYLLNLLYALHYYKIAACPANWGKEFTADKKLREIVNIEESEQIICLIPIGIATEEFSVTLSYRRSVDEVLHIFE